MKHKLLILMLTVSLPVLGQEHIIGIKGGVNWPYFRHSNFNNEKQNRTNIISGFTYQLQADHRFSIIAELLYFQTGRADSLTLVDEFGNVIEEKARIIHNYNYLSIPIKTGFTYGKKISAYFAIGVVPALLINAKTNQSAIDGIIDETKTDITDKIKKFDFAAIAEIGGNYRLNEKYVLSISAAYQESFISFITEYYWPGTEIKHYGIQLSLGLKYILK